MTEQRLKEIEAMVNANNLIMQMIPVSVAKELLDEVNRLWERDREFYTKVNDKLLKLTNLWAKIKND